MPCLKQRDCERAFKDCFAGLENQERLPARRSQSSCLWYVETGFGGRYHLEAGRAVLMSDGHSQSRNEKQRVLVDDSGMLKIGRLCPQKRLKQAGQRNRRDV